VAGRSAETDYCTDGWKDATQKKMMAKEKLMIEIITITMEDAVVLAKAILAEDDAEEVEEAAVDAFEEETIVKRVTILLTAHS
jgi:hypothetical protein